RRLHDSPVTWISAIALAYMIVALLVSAGPALFPAWATGQAFPASRYSPAGWWHLLGSLPLLLVLLFGWIGRLILWWRLMWLISRLDLHLLPAHPDHAAGLLFVVFSLRAWAIPATTPAIMAAGTLANRIIHTGAEAVSYKFLAGGIAAFTVVMFTAPQL